MSETPGIGHNHPPLTDMDFTVDIPTAGAMAGLGRNASYAAAKRGQIPTITLGRLKRVPLKRWRKILETAA